MTIAPTRTPAPWTSWALGLPHGLSQIFFQRSITAGVLLLAAFVVADWLMAVLVLVGAFGGMIGGRLCRYAPSDAASGMLSFCGALVGAAVFAAVGTAWWTVGLALVGGLATGPVTWVIDALFTKTPLARFRLPYTTAPFVIVATIISLATLPWAVAAAASDLPDEPVPAFLLSLLTNVSQVVLVDNPWSGALILAGLFVASWRAGIAAVTGSIVGSVVAVVMGESWSDIANGLANYSGVLTAIALSVTFLRSSVGSWLYALPWIVVTAIVTLAMHRLGLVTYTWPYILTTWVALIVLPRRWATRT